MPVDGTIDGLHAVLTGTANVLHIDTGSGFRDGRLTLGRVDVDPIETLTMRTAR